MLIDFHYYTIKVLAIYAGFTENESQIIAYASQYVDDATKHKKIYFTNELISDFSRYNAAEQSFDPVCTAHKGLSFIKGISSGAQQDVYIPFHFIPHTEFLNQEDYSYTTKANSSFANQLLNWATKPILQKRSERNLIKLGIAIHTYADTWAHQNFSGIYDSENNDLENIHFISKGDWEEIHPLKSLLGNILPDIGHAEALSLPDLSHAKWRYNYSKGDIIRDNASLFLDGAEHIYKHFISITREANNWKVIEPKLKTCFKTVNLQPTLEVFETEFSVINFCYERKEWQNLAIERILLQPNSIDFTTKYYKVLSDKKWFYFHEEAFEQRLYVKRRIKLF